MIRTKGEITLEPNASYVPGSRTLFLSRSCREAIRNRRVHQCEDFELQFSCLYVSLIHDKLQLLFPINKINMYVPFQCMFSKLLYNTPFLVLFIYA